MDRERTDEKLVNALCLLWTIRMGLVSFKIYLPSQNYILRYTYSLFFSFAIHHGHFISIADRTLHGDSSENYFAYTRPANSRLPVLLFSAALFNCVTSSQSIFSFRFAHSLHFYCLRKLDFTLSTRITTHPVEMCKRLNQEHGQLNT